MTTSWLKGPDAKTKFAISFKCPIYIASEPNADLITRLTKYILELEKNIISKEELVSPVPKDIKDPYQHTQQWKQHNLFEDIAGLGGEHLTRFPHNPATDELLELTRVHYLTHLLELGYPRQKVYVHGWANVLRKGEWISKHAHINNENSYLAATYYLTTNNTKLYFENITNANGLFSIPTERGKLILFPSWLPHWSDECKDETLRISIAIDIVTEESALSNPWRPHKLFDDPKTMLGINGK
jgi:hypothetical protein